jgi:hypothetical protein
MNLNLPDLGPLLDCRNVLVAGMGGGFDVFCGLPIYFELRRRGVNVHLANLTFSQLQWLKNGVVLSESLVGISGESHSNLPYLPELHLARWFREQRGEEVTVWCFNTKGARPLLDAYRLLIAHLSVDAVLLVDGGVDSLMRGDEAQTGTVLEDSLSLAAVHEVEGLKARLLACLGMGAEQDVSHAHVFENIAALTEAGAFLGSCSLVRQMEACRLYDEAVEYAHSRRGQDPSVINASVVSAVRGHYGDFHLTEKTRGSRLWISPLMPIYWFFDLAAVAERNLFLPRIRHSESFRESLQAVAEIRQFVPTRKAAHIPLS